MTSTNQLYLGLIHYILCSEQPCVQGKKYGLPVGGPLTSQNDDKEGSYDTGVREAFQIPDTRYSIAKNCAFCD